MSEQCNEHVFSGRRDDFRGHRCTRKAKVDGKCGIHTPEAKQKRKDAVQERYDKKRANSIYGKLRTANKRIA